MHKIQKPELETIKGPFDEAPPTRRKYPRKVFKRFLNMICQGVSQTVEGVEVGEGGISFKSDLILEKEQKLVVSFFLSGSEFFSVPTTVKNISTVADHFIYGVSFDEVDIGLKRKIRAYVATSP